jgi:DNA-binding GntR family transcriptional regulator
MSSQRNDAAADGSYWAANGDGRGLDAPHQDAELGAPAYQDAAHHDTVHNHDVTAGQSGREPADPVLTGRIAASVAQHQPGWLLPRPSVLARRYHVTTEQVAAAIDELAARHLIRLRSDGKACRISPAGYMLELESQHGLSARVEPLHGQLSCRSKSVAWHPVRRDIESALGTAPGDPVCILQMLWTLSGQHAAATTTYLAGPAAEKILAEIEVADLELFRTILPMPPADGSASDGDAEPGGPALIPHALHIEVQQPPPWAARALRLSACDSAIGITVNYAEPADGGAAALTVAVLRPSEFRVIVDSVVTPAQAADFGDPLLARPRATG